MARTYRVLGGGWRRRLRWKSGSLQAAAPWEHRHRRRLVTTVISTVSNARPNNTQSYPTYSVFAESRTLTNEVLSLRRINRLQDKYHASAPSRTLLGPRFPEPSGSACIICTQNLKLLLFSTFCKPLLHAFVLCAAASFHTHATHILTVTASCRSWRAL